MCFFFSSRRRHTRYWRDWSSDVCSSDLRYYDLPRKVILRRAEELLDFVQLSEKVDARVEQLSGGMKRRLLIARALINDPEIVVLDEPTTGLDRKSTRLNSSHANISYDVFCLKKKKISLVY